MPIPTFKLSLLCAAILPLLSCQVQPAATPGTIQTAPQPTSHSGHTSTTPPQRQPGMSSQPQPGMSSQPQPGMSSAVAGDRNHDARIVGMWANPQAKMAFNLDVSGAYQMQVQGNRLQGSWATAQPGVLTLTVNGQVTNYRYEIQSAQLGLQDPQGQVMIFGRMQGPAVATNRPAANTPLRYPSRYQRYNAPTLAYLAETLTRQTPASVAQGLRSLSPMGHQLLAQYPAFAEQLHWLGCQADTSLLLYNSRSSGKAPQNCTRTQASWQSTYQVSSGAVTPTNCAQCGSEMLKTVVTFRCTTGIMSRQECDSFLQQMQRNIDMSHETSIRIINNMGGNNCICGDSGCNC